MCIYRSGIDPSPDAVLAVARQASTIATANTFVVFMMTAADSLNVP